jgi:pyruvate/2-oxoglutarate dehydrogenase complex dihydrolipoamide acyltransferase (E2) component
MARIPGVLTSLSVRAGDSVRKGQVIGRITDTVGYRRAYGGGGGLGAGGPGRGELARVKFLTANGVYAQARLDQAEAMARAGQCAGQRRQRGAGGGPGHGRVLRADVPAGSPVAPGMVVAVVTSGPVVLRLDLPEALAAKVRPGAQVSASRAWRRGHVTRIYPAVQGGQVRPMSPWPGSMPPDRAAYAASLAAGTHRASSCRALCHHALWARLCQVLGKDGTASRCRSRPRLPRMAG